MAGRHYHLRLVGPIALTSLLLLGLCTVVAVYLYRQQARTGDDLHENIGSRWAAANLEGSLEDLVALHRDRLERVEPLHRRIDDVHLPAIERFADKPREKELAAALAASFARYRRHWLSRPAGGGPARDRAARQALRLLQDETLPLCRALRDDNLPQV